MSTTVNPQRLLERFLRYVRIGTPADPSSNEYPSSSQQLELGQLLADELAAMSVDDAHLDENGLVWATIPATGEPNGPLIALIAHVDTSPESPGIDVHPQVLEYNGGDISLDAEDAVIRVADYPELNSLVGKTLITTDGRSLLGGDDKAGVAIIMELAQQLIENTHVPHGPIRILFTCDEEIGRGTDKIDLDKLAAVAAYTIDGGGHGDLDVETFSADGAVVCFTGQNIHPAIAKGRMVNAARAAAFFVEQLPREHTSPETTDGRDGFIHPYEISGGVGETTVRLILRSFDSAELEVFANTLRAVADTTREHFPGLEVSIDVTRQYRNLGDGLKSNPLVADLAEQAFNNLGRPVERTIIRGGTDGSLLTEKGLPTPNLSSGQHAIHSLHEFACLDEMVEAIEHLEELAKLWNDQGRC